MKLNPWKYMVILALAGLALLSSMAFTSCAAVGPDYVRPETPMPETYTEKSTAALSEDDQKALETWWTAFNDPVLTDLIERALAANLSLKEAYAKVREVRSQIGVAKGGLLPSLSATGKSSYTQNDNDQGNWTRKDSYGAGLDLSWEIDFFGRTRREVQAAQADFEAAREDMRNVRVSLTAETAAAYVNLRTYRQQLVSAEENRRLREETLELAKIKYQAGLTGGLDVEQATYNLESARSKIPALETSIAEMKNRLAVLLGGWPGDLDKELQASSAIPLGSLDAAMGVPADLLRRRPDIRGAERRLAAQTARIGVAKADLYPSLNLTGSLGYEALALSGLISPANLVAAYGLGVSWKIFNFGAVRANIEVKNAQQEQALLEYEAALRTAVEEVDNVLVGLAKETRKQEALEGAVTAAGKAADLAHQEYQNGISDFQKVLETQQSLMTYQDSLIQSRGQSALDLITLYKALGGGWSQESPRRTTDPKSDQTADR